MILYLYDGRKPLCVLRTHVLYLRKLESPAVLLQLPSRINLKREVPGR